MRSFRLVRLAAVLLPLAALAACHDAATPPVASAAAGAAAPAATLDARRQQLRDVIADEWEYVLRTSPEFASVLGDKRYNDRWSDASEEAVQAQLAENRRYVARLDAIDLTGFPEDERLNEVLLARRLKLGLESAKFEDWLMPVSQISGPHLDMAELVRELPFTSVKDYDDYITRLQTLPRVLDANVVNMRKGLTRALMPPKFLLEKVPDQASVIASASPDASPFAAPLASFPAAVPEAEQKRIRAAVLAAITGK